MLVAVSLLTMVWPRMGYSQSPADPTGPDEAIAESESASLQGQINALSRELRELKSQPGRNNPIREPASAPIEGASWESPDLSPLDPTDCLTPDVANDDMPLFVTYGYNAGGGFTRLADANEEFTVNLQNQLTLDGTFYDQPQMPTAELGFNIPFFRSYLFGNITRDWDYQFAVQGFLGEFNILDAWVNYTVNEALHVRAGRMLSPLLYEYYAFSPAWEPVITNSLLFQVAGKRQIGIMAWGQLLENQAQYQAGVFNGIEGGFYDLDHNVDFLGSLTLTPWKGSRGILDSLGFGAGVQLGQQDYALNAGNTAAFINGAGEPTLNFNYINSTGIPFFQYNDDVVANGLRTKFAPHFFWYGRFSLQAECIWQRRALADSQTSGITRLNGYQVTTSYLLTGEAHSGDGLGGWAMVVPRAPFVPSRGEFGPGAWELAFQYSTLDVGTDNFDLGFADPATSTNRIDQTMLGLNWWPNKYTRLSFDWMNNQLNRPVPTGPQILDHYNTYWFRAAMFF